MRLLQLGICAIAAALSLASQSLAQQSQAAPAAAVRPAPPARPVSPEIHADRSVTFRLLAPKAADKSADSVAFAQVSAVIGQRCVTCHAVQPTFAGFSQPPKGVVLESADQIGMHAAKLAETTASRYMPIGNLTQMTDAERALIASWYAQGATVK